MTTLQRGVAVANGRNSKPCAVRGQLIIQDEPTLQPGRSRSCSQSSGPILFQ